MQHFIERSLVRFWQKPLNKSPFGVRIFYLSVLGPFALLYGLGVAVRRWLYRVGLKKTQRFSTPIIVVGNITVGGSGKTPLVSWLALYLRSQGYTPGIVSRGYRGKHNARPTLVTQASRAQDVGDEALLLALQTDCPLVVGVDRVAAVSTLLAEYPACNIIVADDGLQHLALQSALKIAVVDETLEASIGGRYYFPLGRLRESRQRLHAMDIVIKRQAMGAVSTSSTETDNSRMQLVVQGLYTLSTGKEEPLDYLMGRTVHAVAGIGQPKRFFDQLERLGCRQVIEHPFPDHHLFNTNDFAKRGLDNDDVIVVMTEKDAVKCRAFARTHYFTLAVRVEPNASFIAALNACLI